MERLFNILLGLSVLSWGVLRWLGSDAASRHAPVQWTIIALHFCAGTLLVLRAPAIREGSPGAIVLSVPSFVAGLWLLRMAPAPSQWPPAATICFVAGGAVVMLSILWLGRSFAILPAVRAVVGRGPYRLVRHPAYGGECVMLAAGAFSHASIASIALLVAAIPLMAVRILAEEQMLRNSPDYVEYSRHVRWRLLPGLW